MGERYRFKALGPFKVPTVRSGRWKTRRVDFESARDAVFDEAERICDGALDVRAAVGC
jgi:hypothetical protein